MPWRAVITRPVPRPATAGPAPPAAHHLFPPGREHQHPGGEPAWPARSPPAGRIGRPSCGGPGRSVNCSGPGISAALDLPEDEPNPGIPQVKAAQGMPAGLDLRRTLRGIWNGTRNRRFPRGRSELADDAVEFVARQPGVPASELGFYEWSGHTFEY